MPYSVQLPQALVAQGWKMKIRDKERLEPPHVTLMCRTKEWRVNLRDLTFLVPPGGSWDDIPEEIQRVFTGESLRKLRYEWD